MPTLHTVPMLPHTIDPALFYTARAITPDEPDDPLENASDAPDSPPSPPSPEGHGRQKSSAALRSFEPSAFSGQNICTNVTSNSWCNQRLVPRPVKLNEAECVICIIYHFCIIITFYYLTCYTNYYCFVITSLLRIITSFIIMYYCNFVITLLLHHY